MGRASIKVSQKAVADLETAIKAASAKAEQERVDAEARFAKEREGYERSLENARQSHADLNETHKGSLENALKTVSAENTKMHKELARAQREAIELTAARREHDAQAASLKVSLESAERAAQATESENAKLRAELKATQERLAKEDAELAQAKRETDRLKEEVKKDEQKIDEFQQAQLAQEQMEKEISDLRVHMGLPSLEQLKHEKEERERAALKEQAEREQLEWEGKQLREREAKLAEEKLAFEAKLARTGALPASPTSSDSPGSNSSSSSSAEGEGERRDKPRIITAEEAAELASRARDSILQGDCDAAIRFIDEGASFDAKSPKGESESLLLLACDQGKLDRVSLHLIEKGADVNAHLWNGESLLMFACKNGREELALKLIEKGANVHAKLPFFDTTALGFLGDKSKRIRAALLAKGAKETL
jgi:hypothetical protein